MPVREPALCGVAASSRPEWPANVLSTLIQSYAAHLKFQNALAHLSLSLNISTNLGWQNALCADLSHCLASFALSR